jgi:hypothetical protein
VPSSKKILGWLAGLLVLSLAGLLAGAWLARVPLTAWVLRRGLAGAGATDVSFAVTEVSLRRLAVEHLGLKFFHQPLTAARVTLIRDRPFSTSLGRLQVSGLTATVAAADLPGVIAAVRAEAGAAETSAGKTAGGSGPIPLEGISVDGKLVIKTGGAADTVAVTFEAAPKSAAHWAGRMELAAPGLTATAAGDYDFAAKTGAFQLTAARVELAPFREFAGTLTALPLGGWTVDGVLTATGAGAFAAGKFSARAAVQLRGGKLENAAEKISLDGITADFAFTDLPGFVTAPGQAAGVQAGKIGDVAFHDADFRVQLAGLHVLRVERATAAAFDGGVGVEPFQFDPAKTDYAFTAVLDGLHLEEVLQLFPTVKATGRGVVDGFLPVRYDAAGGLHFATGWLSLKQGTSAEMRFDYGGLLTSGVSPDNRVYPTLKNLETGRLPLQLTAMRIDVHPPNAPAGRYAQVHIEGEAVDAQLKLPVSFDVNINGPLEALINWGLSSRLRVSGGR